MWTTTRRAWVCPGYRKVVEAFLVRDRARHRLLRGTSLVTADELSRSTER